MNMKQSNPVTTNDNSYETSEEETQAKLLEGEVLQNRVMAKLDPDRPESLSSHGWQPLVGANGCIGKNLSR